MVPNASHLEGSTGTVEGGTSVDYSCDAGLAFAATGSSTSSTVCVDTNTWSEINDACVTNCGDPITVAGTDRSFGGKSSKNVKKLDLSFLS